MRLECDKSEDGGGDDDDDKTIRYRWFGHAGHEQTLFCSSGLRESDK